MKCDSDQLRYAIEMAMPIISTRSPSYVCKSLLFSGKKLYSTNFTTFAEVNLPDGLEFTKDALVDAKQLDALTRYLKGSVEITITDSNMCLEDENGKCKVPLRTGEMPRDDKDPGEFMAVRDISSCVKIAREFVASASSVRAHEGILIRKGGVFSTDARIMLHIKTEEDLGADALIPPQEVGGLCRGGDVGIATTDRRIHFKYGAGTISTSKLDATFPNVSSVTNMSFDKHIKLNTKGFHNIIRQCMSLSDDNEFVKISVWYSNDKLYASSSTEKGEVSTSMEASGESNLDCNMNAFLISKFLKSISSDTITISSYSTLGNGGPVRIRGISSPASGEREMDAYVAPLAIEDTGPQAQGEPSKI